MYGPLPEFWESLFCFHSPQGLEASSDLPYSGLTTKLTAPRGRPGTREKALPSQYLAPAGAPQVLVELIHCGIFLFQLSASLLSVPSLLGRSGYFTHRKAATQTPFSSPLLCEEKGFPPPVLQTQFTSIPSKKNILNNT